jgi:hypothetical protein
MPTVKLEMGKEWEEFERQIKPALFKQRLEREARRATTWNLVHAKDEIRRRIKAGRYEPNSERTAHIKGSTTPLIDMGTFWRNITEQRITAFEGIVGVIRSRPIVKRQKEGRRVSSLFSVAAALHDGTVIRVTPKMRRYFAYMARKHPGKWWPIKPSTTIMVIKPRPFIDEPMNDPMLKTIVVGKWVNAVERAFAPGGK